MNDIKRDPGSVKVFNDLSMRSASITLGCRIEYLFDTVGDGSGSTEMAAASNIYKIAPPGSCLYRLCRMNIYIEDNGKFRADRYGVDASLLNGVRITSHDSSGSVCLYTPQPIKKIGHWHLLAGEGMTFTNFPAGNDAVNITWEFHDGGGDLVLDGSEGEFLQIEIRDDLSDLESHMAQVQGTKAIIS